MFRSVRVVATTYVGRKWNRSPKASEDAREIRASTSAAIAGEMWGVMTCLVCLPRSRSLQMDEMIPRASPCAPKLVFSC